MSSDDELLKICTWGACFEEQYGDTPVCLRHALIIGGRVKGLLWAVSQEPEPMDDHVWVPRRYVYYLMANASAVKIGTTTRLPARLNSLRSDAQYVVALERGGVELEKSRHAEFASDRIGRREDFRISPKLETHIKRLAAKKDELLKEAFTAPFGEMVAKSHAKVV